jgi:hypothetical protein
MPKYVGAPGVLKTLEFWIFSHPPHPCNSFEMKLAGRSGKGFKIL